MQDFENICDWWYIALVNSVALVSSILRKKRHTHIRMAPPDDDNVGGGQGGAAGNAGGNGGNAVVDRLKSLELGGLSSFDPKGYPTRVCARGK